MRNSDWWWETLQASIGPVVGALIAVCGVILSLHVARQRERENAIQKETRRLLGISRGFKRDLVGLNPMAAVDVPLRAMELSQDLGFLGVRVQATEPYFRDALELFSEWISRGIFGKSDEPNTASPQTAINGNQNLQEYLSLRLSEPAHFRRISKADGDEMISGLRELMEYTTPSPTEDTGASETDQ